MSRLKVLMADDELPIRKWFAKTFKTLPGIKVDLVGVATNGEEALNLFRETKPDVIFADIKMPSSYVPDRHIPPIRPFSESVTTVDISKKLFWII